ncbi:MAG: Uncharacterized protein G01um101429_32 [Parcubacteria group bacterium Gr01-1014_29]|nr:MAG: Uncharacterized protein G01um101429_32 [Parcubacteria group bacterium Gr01-1014_29]
MTGVLIAIGGTVIVRLFFLQVSYADEYQATAERQHNALLLDQSRRGDIFFEDKDGVLVPAATTHRTYTLEGNPRQIENPTALYEKFVALLPLDKDTFLERASARDTTYTVFMQNISRDTAANIANFTTPEIWLSKDEKRVYPQGTMASHLLGFVGFSDIGRSGRYGLEQQYEDILNGSDARSGFAQNGSDLILTIDPHIQSIAHELGTKLVETWNAVSAGILVLEPKTGAILAMDSMPGFNPNAYQEVKDYDIFLNPFTQKVFEMGSIVKPLTMAAGLDARSITEATTYYDAGQVQIGDATLSNYDGKGRGLQRMYDILDQSLNTGAVFIMQQLGKRAFHDYMRRFGLGESTGVDLGQEVAGNLSNLEIGNNVEYATASFGQGIAVTPLGLASALSAVANGGELMRPYIVKRIEDTKGVSTETLPAVRRRVLRTETTEIVSRMLADVVDKTLAGGIVSMPRYRIAAKTGTAQISNKTAGGYSDMYLHTFFGYAPAFDPRFLILLYLEEPRGVRYASQTLSEPFRKLAEFIITYYKIPPDR